jgi:CTP:molybdopterin cytidylyltransferase MocA
MIACGIVLAAGAGTRFGGPKQLASFRGRPLLEHAVAAAASAETLSRVVVTLGAYADEILAAIDLHGAEPVVVADWEQGQSASLRAGVRALAADVDAVVVLLGDQPLVSSRVVDHVVRSWRPGLDAARATYRGQPGHPVVLGRSLFNAVDAISGDAGARSLFRSATVLDLECGSAAVLDVDTPEQLASVGRTRPPA